MISLGAQITGSYSMRTISKIDKLVFVVPPLLSERVEFYPDFPTPPLGIGYVSANVGNDYKRNILDLSFHDSLTEIYRVLDRIDDYDVYAFTSMTPNFKSVLKVAEYLRKHKEGLFVIGGSHVTVVPEILTNSDIFDIGVIGEGEVTFKELMQVIATGQDFREIKGIAYKDGKGNLKFSEPRPYLQNIDCLEFPDRHLFDMNKYIEQFNSVTGGKGLTLICSRGCPYDCVFCSKEIFGRAYRLRSPQNILAEVKQVVSDYDTATLHFIDDTFTINHKFVYDFCDEIKANRLDIQWQCESRVDTVDHKLISKMRESGCIRIMFGVESGDQQILNRMNKQITLDQIRRAFEIAGKEGIDTGAFIMLGFPGETTESLQKTVELVKLIKPRLISVSFTNILPGTQLYKRYWDSMPTNDQVFGDYHLRSNIESPQLPLRQLIDAREEIFKIVRGSG